MEIKMQTRTETILKVMLILAWVAFVAFMVEAGAILVSYGVSCVNPEGARNLYKGLDLFTLRQYNFWHYTLTVSFMIALSILKAIVSFLMIKTLSKVNLINPFSLEVARLLERISYVLLGMWVLAMVNNLHTGWMLQDTGKLQVNYVNGDFIFTTGLVFIIAQIFKRGVEIQSENELTV